LPAIACFLSIATYAVALAAQHVWTFIVADFQAEFIAAAGLPPIFAAMHAVCGNRRRTMAVAAALLLFALFGSGIGPPLAGAVSDALRSVYGPDSLRYSLVTILGFLLPAGGAFYWAGCAMPKDLED
jgi:fucose permease